MKIRPEEYTVPVLKKLVKTIYPELATKNMKKAQLLDCCTGRLVCGSGSSNNPFRLVSVAGGVRRR